MKMTKNYKSFLTESSFEQKIKGIIKKQGYAVFTDGKGIEAHITDTDEGWGFGMTNLDDDIEINLKNPKADSKWSLEEGSTSGDIAQGTSKLEDDEDEDMMADSAVGLVGRTGSTDADNHLAANPDLLKRLRKIIKELGGLTATRKLMQQMSSRGLTEKILQLKINSKD